VSAVDVSVRSQVRSALKACLVKVPGEQRIVDRILDVVFPRLPIAHDAPHETSTSGDSGAESDLAEALARDEQELQRLLASAVDEFSGTEDGRSVEHHVMRTLRKLDLAEIYRRYLNQFGPDSSDLERSFNTADAAEAIERLQREVEALVVERLRDRIDTGQEKDLQDRAMLKASSDELARLRSAIRPLARQLAARLNKRRRRSRGTLDMRRTIRASMATGGVPARVALRKRHRTRPDLVVLCDVSGSTAEFAPFTLALLHAVHQEFHRVRSFAFVDGIVEITDALQNSPGVLDPRHLLDRRGLVAGDGRSDYLSVFTRFLAEYGDIVTARTTVVICGDARSHDRPPAIGPIRELAHRSRKLFWLNPEIRQEWNTKDSHLESYSIHCDGTYEVATLRQLADAVAAIA
jgi:uncharacterized protein with von Willebrand factor type A (vWA) domain